MSRAWFALAVAAVLGLFYVGSGLRGHIPPAGGTAFGQEVQVKPIFKQAAEPAKTGLKFRFVDYQGSTEIHRAKIPGGWLVSAHTPNRDNNENTSVTFVPDSEHKWDGKSLP